MLHWCALTVGPADLRETAFNSHPHASLVSTLLPQWQGLLPGFHRISLERGRVLLTLCVGDWANTWRQLHLTADSVLLEAPFQPPPSRTPSPAPDMASEVWTVPTLKALARSSHRGTRFAVQATHTMVNGQTLTARMRQCGFRVDSPPDAPLCHGTFDPSWEPKRGTSAYRNDHPLGDHPLGDHPLGDHASGAHPLAQGRSQTAVVVGAGLAGAAVAHSLAQRGWQVRVLDAAAQPAMGASGLPAGLVVPHVSPDDSILSQLSRAGLRITRQHLQDLLTPGADWSASGVMEHRTDAQTHALWRNVPQAEAGQDWTREASPDQLSAAGLPADTIAWWHPMAAWVKPAALVQRLLNHPRVTWQGHTQVQGLHRTEKDWIVYSEQLGTSSTHHADLVVLAAAYDTQALLASMSHPSPLPLPIQPVRGQASWAREADIELAGAQQAGKRPPFPVNGLGSLISQVPDDGGAFWILGSTFERDEANAHSSDADLHQRHLANLAKLQTLLPLAAAELAAVIDRPSCPAFVGIRCASADRLPLVGLVNLIGDGSKPETPLQSLCVSTAMGSRGLTFALLCAELLAAQLHGEPWPLEKRLAQALDIRRVT